MDNDRGIALVTGAGRRRGIGAAICRELADAGSNIIFTYWHAYDAAMPWGAEPEAPEVLRHEIEASGVRCSAIELDLSRPDAATELLDAASSSLGRPSVLVNNAAVSFDTNYRSLEAASLDAHYAVNLRSTALLCVEFARRHPAGTPGRIINLTSGQSLGPMPDELAYIATKGATEALTTSLAPPLAALGITVNAVNPGPTDTGWMTDEVREAIRTRSPAGRLATPADCARLVRFLASDAAEWITGQVIHSEGGFLRA